MFQTNNSPIRWVLVLYPLDRGGLWGTVLKEDWEVESLCKFMHLYSEAKCPFGCKHTTSLNHLVYSHHSPDGHQDVPLPTFFFISCPHGFILWLTPMSLPWRRLPWFSSVAHSCLTLCDPMDCSTTGFSVLHHLPELTQTHIHWVSDAIQPAHSLSSPSPPASNLSQNQGLFKWVRSSHKVAKVLEFQLQHLPLKWIFRTDFL